MKKIVAAKMHGIRVTNADLNYHGSITLDPLQCHELGILPLEFVEIYNKNSGARLSTYVIYGEPGSKCCVLNGAAARTCQVGDEVIICSSEYVNKQELAGWRTKVMTFTAQNEKDQILTYAVDQLPDERWDFQIQR
ncbi:aspartate 1-decarboxylase [Polycladidibacter hongkongensis]|uniref:aspartate 1-decarboxylase n=1 Tax=Polycladidibacter hongkongensis TaxID=1647556 RepID=UPI00082B8C22|nr:aspartate 1-decarboxylase [Pseudovibrio hongkongensis]